MVDEVYFYGVYGYGIVYNEKLVNKIDFLVILLGKVGVFVGVYVICDEIYKNYLINKSKKFIYLIVFLLVNNLWNLFVLENLVNF